MLGDGKLFEDFNKSFKSKVKIVHDECLEVEGKGMVSIESCVGTMLITEVLLVPKINQNL